MRVPVLNLVLVFLLWISGSVQAYCQGTRIDFSSIPKSGTILIYSHQDDDLIWMLPFWRITEKFIAGAMPSTPIYRTIINQQQTFLNNNGYNIQYQANWFAPWDDITDTEYSQFYLAANTSYNYLLNDHLEPRLYNNPTELPRSEINKLKAKLEQYFADPANRRIITHNNWGEYGHQHHKALNKAVRELAVKYRKDVWMLGCNNGGFIDVTVPNGITWTYGSFNTPDLFTGIRTIYLNNGRWTWYTDRIPSGDHKFIKIVDGGNDRSNILTGEAITSPGPSQLESGAYIFDGNDDYLTLKGNNNTSFTISLRIRPDQIREMDIAYMAEYPLSSKNDRNLSITADGHIVARIYDGSSRTATSSAVIPGGTWTHIAITANGGNLKLYINGALDRTISAGTAITNYSTPEFVLGQPIRTTAFFRGQISTIGFYSRALSDNEISQLSGSSYTITSSAGTGGSISPSGAISVRAGASQSFSIAANRGYTISEVRVDNNSVGAVSSYRFTNITSNHRITASFRQISYTITAEAGSGGTITPNGNISVNNGAQQKFSIKPATGYRISDVKVDDVSVGARSEYTFDNVTSSHTIKASFTLLSFNIVSGSDPNGTITPAGTLNFNYGQDQSYSITPALGFRIKDVLVDKLSVGAVPVYAFKGIAADHSIYATFMPVSFTVTGIAGTGGSINPAGPVKVMFGKDQKFTVESDFGFIISGVLVDNKPVPYKLNDFTITNVRSDHTVSFQFSRIKVCKITSGPVNNGSLWPEGDLLVTEGSQKSFKITPDAGFRISNVFIDTIPIGPVNEYTFFNITDDHSISATFTKDVKFEIYPNPFRSSFNVHIRSPFDDVYTVRLVSLITGAVTDYYEVPANSIFNIRPGFRPGVYSLSIYLKGKKVYTTRVVKY